jgi:hypothetical protein
MSLNEIKIKEALMSFNQEELSEAVKVVKEILKIK